MTNTNESNEEKRLCVITELFCITGDIMQDILYDAAISYKNSRNIRYEIKLGRKI